MKCFYYQLKVPKIFEMKNRMRLPDHNNSVCYDFTVILELIRYEILLDMIQNPLSRKLALSGANRINP